MYLHSQKVVCLAFVDYRDESVDLVVVNFEQLLALRKVLERRIALK